MCHWFRRSANGVRASFAVAVLAALLPAASDAEEEASAVWVIFRDKALASPAEEAAALEAARTSLTPRCRARRAKTRPASSLVDLLDVPVPDRYRRQVYALGASPRATSRWLGSISVDATPAQVEAIEQLPFVAAVRPVARGARTPESVTPVSLSRPENGRVTPDYGHSASQLLPHQVDLLHAAGYTGAGVLVCLLDTGFSTVHESVDSVTVVAARDFINDDNIVSNEPEDNEYQHNHGSYVLSLIAGYAPGLLIGPAFGASFLLGKTEDITSETSVEEDYWVEGIEWADSLGADIVSSSLGYKNWYAYSDMDGNTATTTIAGDLAVANGIAVFSSAGNEGDDPWLHVTAPADGDSVLAVGSIDTLEVVSVFSSRGPTYDGRTKPDFCAVGEGTIVGLPVDSTAYARGSGTSFSCPIAAGVGALLLEAHPAWPPMELAAHLRGSASRAGSHDNDYGWGVLRGWDAHLYSPTGVETPPTPAAGDGRLLASPNPSADAVTLRWSRPGSSREATLCVHDIAGRRVALWQLGPEANGQVRWDGCNDRGVPVAAGIYLARLTTPSGSVVARIVRIR
ncbi:MAG: S8 family serine peptidase [Gemmatimonadota bacterium]|jgi:subtilisin family serine protease|nr:S8 family serine peptidase [Gemmatimonadota bacterium]MDP6803522.1 S8 family serine peptidase [Gemmatimonadota bacterium]MDP7032698.1 S8 family serine peptidase [Gemmatimonadota bacterium]